MNVKTTIALLALLALVGAYFWFVERKSPPEQAPVTDARQPGRAGEALFTDLKADAVASITIERDGSTVVFTREGSEWFQTQPVRFPLNNWSLDDLAEQAVGLRFVEKFTPAPGSQNYPSAADISLTPPLATVTVAFKDDKPRPRVLRLGRKAAGGRAYLSIDDDPLAYVVEDRLHNQILDKEPNTFRKRNLTAPGEAQAGKVALQRGGQTITLVKTDADWSFAAPHRGRASAEKVRELLTAVTGIYIDKFVEDNPKDPALYGLDKPTATLTIHTAAAPKPQDHDDHEGHEHETPAADQPQVHTLVIGGPADLSREKFFATYSPGNPAVPPAGAAPGVIVFTVGKSGVEKFERQPDDLRDPRLTPVKNADVSELEAEGRDLTAFKITRAPDLWRFTDPHPGYAADDAACGALLSAILDAKAQSYLTESTGLGARVAKVTLTVIGRPEPEVLAIHDGGEAHAGKLVVYRGNERIGYVVEAKALEKLFAPLMTLRDRTVLDIPRAKVATVKLKRGDGAEFVFERELPAASEGDEQPPPPGPWKLSGHERFELSAFEALLNQLTPLTTPAWDTQPYLIAEEEAAVTLNDVTVTVNTKTRQARATGVDAAFEVRQDLLSRLEAEYRDRTLIAASSEQIESVTIGALKVTKNADGKYVAENGQELDQSAAAGLFDALAGLRVEKYVSPVQIRQTDVTRSITLVTKDGGAVGLSLVSLDKAPDRRAFVSEDRWFTLSENTYNKLNAELGKKAEEDTQESD